MADRRLSGRIALVTGASRGIGRAAALALARAGAHVVLTARTKGGLEELDDEIRGFGGTATIAPLNLAHLDKLDALGPSLYQRFERLDILVANAAILGPLSPLDHVKAEDWQRVLDINLSANWRLIRTLDPLLKRSEAGRAVFLSSSLAARQKAYWGPYAVSKAALEALVKTYALELATTAVRVNCLDPGATRTQMRATAMPGEDPLTLPTPEQVANVIVAMAMPDYTSSGTVVEARQHPAFTAVAEA